MRSTPAPRLLLTAALAFSGCVLHVQGPNGTQDIKLGPKSDHEKLSELNDRVNASRKLLLDRVGEDLPKEKAKLDQAGRELAAERADLSDSWKGEAEAYKSVSENLADAESWLATTRLAWEGESAVSAAEKADAAGKTPTEKELAAADTKVKAFQAKARKEWKDAAGRQAQRLAELRLAISEGPARREAAQAHAAAQARAKADEAQRKKAQQAGHEANQALQELYKVMSRHEVPEESAIAELEKRAGAVEAIYPAGGRFYRTEAASMRTMSALNQPDAAERLKALLGGEVVASGEAHGKSFSVPVKGKKGHCYVLLGRIINWGGQEAIEQPGMTGPKAGPPMQEFRISWANEAMLADKWKSMTGQGFCATRDGEVTFEGGLKVAGTKNGLRYAVLDYPRAQFPAPLAMRLNLDLPDHCDAEAWATMFTDPVPGTLAYLDGEPVLITSTDPAGGNQDASIHYASDAGGWSHTKKAALASAPPKQVKFKHPFKWQACPERQGDVMPRAPASRAIAECGLKIEKKYGKDWDEVEAARTAARNVSTSQVSYYSPTAEAKAGRLMAAYDKEFAQKCQPLVDRTEKQTEARFNKLVDQLTDAPPTDPLRRAELAAEEEEAPFRRW